MSKSAYMFVVVAAVGLGCKSNPQFCAGHPGNNCLLDSSGDGTQSCSSDQQCSGATPVCDVAGTKTCVQCAGSDDAQCTGTSPVCGSNDACRACEAHVE